MSINPLIIETYVRLPAPVLRCVGDSLAHLNLAACKGTSSGELISINPQELTAASRALPGGVAE